VVFAVLTWLTFAVFRPTPPRSVTMAIDPKGSFSAEVAMRYRDLLARNGVELKLVQSRGAIESVAWLQDPKSVWLQHRRIYIHLDLLLWVPNNGFLKHLLLVPHLRHSRFL
jgi:hypothetical protein